MGESLLLWDAVLTGEAGEKTNESLGTKLCRGSGVRFSLNNAELEHGVPSWDHMPSGQASRATENPSWQMTPLSPHIAMTNYLLLEVSLGQVSFSQLHHLKRRSSGVTFCQFCVFQSSWILGGCCLARWSFIQAEPSALCVSLGILPSHTDNLTIKWISELGGLWMGVPEASIERKTKQCFSLHYAFQWPYPNSLTILSPQLSGNPERKLCQINQLKLAFGVDPRVSGFLWVADSGQVAFISYIFVDWINEWMNKWMD